METTYINLSSTGSVMRLHYRRNKRLYKCTAFLILLYILYILCEYWWLIVTERSYQQVGPDGTRENHQLDAIEVHNITQIPTNMDTDVQAMVDYIASKLDVRVNVSDNFVDGGANFVAVWRMQNKGLRSIPSSKWQLYYFYPRPPVLSDKYDRTPVELAGGWMKSQHVNGGLFMMEAQATFPAFAPDAVREFQMKSISSCLARTDFYPNWYVTADGAKPRVLDCTRSEALSFIGPFDEPQKWKRAPQDTYNPYTPQVRYERNVGAIPEGVASDRDLYRIIPAPKEMTTDETSVLDFKPLAWKVLTDDKFSKEATFLADQINVTILKSTSSGKVIRLVHDESIGAAEAYKLDIVPSRTSIEIRAGTTSGAFYGVQSLLALISNNGRLYKTHIEDSPRFEYRGLMLDVARNFWQVDEVTKLLDAMAMYKMNRLHMHLSDDEGWRIEIPGIPELTEIGGRRGHDVNETSSLLPALGSGPYTHGLGSGFYSVKDYRTILQHASDRHITIIPEIDIPGHSNAAIKALKVRYNRYKDTDPKKAGEFLVYDMEDQSYFWSVQSFVNDVINPCVKTSYAFVEHVMESLKYIHKVIQPLETFHLGGDEVARDALQDSPACEAFRSEHPELDSISKLKEYFIQQSIQSATKLGLKVQGWEDAFYGANNNLFNRSTLGSHSEDGIVANVWLQPMRVNQLTSNGYKVVLSSASYLYLDHPHEPDPEEKGLYWATRFIDFRKIFNFCPEKLVSNKDVDRFGNPYNREDLCDPDDPDKCDNIGNINNLLGMQGQLWSETTRTTGQLESMIFPRLLMLAEKSWHKSNWEDMETDATRIETANDEYARLLHALVQRELPRLDRMGVEYYLPPPGAIFTEDGSLKVNSALPGLPVQYSLDQGKSWHNLDGKADVGPTFQLATRCPTTARRSRAISIVKR